MTTLQYKVSGIILMVVAAIGLILGIIGVIDVHDANQMVNQMNAATGGLLGAMGKDMGVETQASYVRPLAFILVSAVIGFLGFKLLGKKEKSIEAN